MVDSRKRIPGDSRSRCQIGMYAKIKGMLKNEGKKRKKNAARSRVVYKDFSQSGRQKNLLYSLDRFRIKKLKEKKKKKNVKGIKMNND